MNNPEFWYNKEKETWGELNIGRHTFTGKKRGAGAPETAKLPTPRPSDTDLVASQMQDIVSTEKSSPKTDISASKPKSFSEEVLNLDEIYAPVLNEPSKRDDTPAMSVPTMSAQDWIDRDNKISGLSLDIPAVRSALPNVQTTPPTRLPDYTPPTTNAFAEKSQVTRDDIPSLMPEQPSVSVTEPTIGQPKAESGKLPQMDIPSAIKDYAPMGKRKVTDAKAFLAERAAKKATQDEKKKPRSDTSTEGKPLPTKTRSDLDKAREKVDRAEESKMRSGEGPMSVEERFAAEQEAFTGFDSAGNFTGFKEGGLASKLKKPKPKKRNTKKGLGGKSMAT
jgi:hypothetical protein